MEDKLSKKEKTIYQIAVAIMFIAFLAIGNEYIKVKNTQNPQQDNKIEQQMRYKASF